MSLLTLYKKQKFYIRISIVLLLILIIIITPITLTLSQQFSKYANQEINRFTQENTYQAKERVNYLLDRLKFLSFSIYTDERVEEYVSLQHRDPSVNRNVQFALSNYILNEPFIYSVYAINPTNQTVFDSRKGPMLYENFHDKNILDQLEDDKNILQYFVHEVDGINYLALIVTTIFDSNGFIVVLLDIEKLSEFLLQTNHAQDINVMIVNEKIELLLGETENFLPTIPIKEKLFNNEKRKGYFETTLNNEPWLVNYDTLNSYDYKIVTLTNFNAWNQDISGYKNKLFFLMLILIIFLFLIILWGSYRTYQPFSQLSDYVKNKFAKDMSDNPPNSEYKLIKHSINLLEENVNKLNVSHKEYLGMIKSEYLRQWILQEGNVKDLVQHIKNEFHFVEYSFSYLAVIRIDSYQSFVDQYNFSSRKIMKNAIGKIMEETFNIALEHCDIEIVDLGSDHIVLLINTDIAIGNDQENLFADAKEKVKKYLDENVTIAVSNSLNTNEGLRSIYNKIYEISNIKFITGEDRIYKEEDYFHYRGIMHLGNDDIAVENLIKTVRLGQKEEIERLLKDIVNNLRRLSYEEAKFQLSVIMYQIFRSFNQHTSLTGFHGIQDQLKNFETIDGFKSWMEEELLSIVKNLQKREMSNRKSDLAKEIKEFINTRLHDPLLTTDMIADFMSLSVSYTRQVFKEVYDQTLNDYIVKKRMEDVLQLLRTKDWNINSIAEYCGFQTKSNFYTMFKKVVGMTPSEYRKKYNENQ